MMNKIQTLPTLEEIWQKTLNWQPNVNQHQRFQKLYEAIILGNRQLNLTRITKPMDFWEKHLWDSLAGIPQSELEVTKQQSLSVIDIGTGAGFPGIPVAIALPNWTVTLVDSIHKKIFFLNELTIKLELKNIKTLIGRAEKIKQSNFHKESYDMALIRAVGNASICAEYALPLIKVGGLAILYRGHWYNEDKLALETTLDKLGGQIDLTHELVTPLSKSTRHYIHVRKILTSPI